METTRELASETWSVLRRRQQGAAERPVSTEIVDMPGQPSIEAKHLALKARTFDQKDDVFEVPMARGDTHLPSVLRHLVDHPERVAVDSQTMLAPMTIAVDGRDGVRTLAKIGREPEITS